MYVYLCIFADVDIVVTTINASTAIRLLYVNTKEVFQPGRLLPEVSMMELVRAGRRVRHSSTTPEEVLCTNPDQASGHR